MPRFSDEQLTEMYNDFELYKEEQEVRWGQIAALVERNTQAIERLSDNTEDVVRLHRDLQGAARIGIGLPRVFGWLASLGASGSVVAAAVTYLIDKIGPGI